MRLGLPEIVVVLTIVAVWVVPIAAGVWALRTLHRLRTVQEDMRRRLDVIEGLLQRTTAS